MTTIATIATNRRVLLGAALSVVVNALIVWGCIAVALVH
jgi:hypothetical protein